MGALYYNGSKLKKVYYNGNQLKKLYYNNNLVYTSELTLSKYTGSVNSLSTTKSGLAATTVGNYALFAGGASSNSSTNTVDAYNSSLTKSTATNLSTTKSGLAATTIGNYAIFAGGLESASYDYSLHMYHHSYSSIVDAYNSSLTKSTATNLSTARSDLAATTIGNYALFAGGTTIHVNPSSGPFDLYYSTVDVYNSSLTKSTASSTSLQGKKGSATTVGNYALINTLVPSSYSIDAYNKSLTKTNITNAHPDYNSEYYHSASTVGDYAIFYGGRNSKIQASEACIAYNSSLTAHSVTRTTTFTKMYNTASSIGDYALFAGGNSYSFSNDCNNPTSNVIYFDKSLIQFKTTSLSTARFGLAATTIGNYAIFAGGNDGDSTCSTVDVYQVSY